MWVCASIRPGITHSLLRSMTRAPGGTARLAPIALILPPSMTISCPLALVPWAGSMTVPARTAMVSASTGTASNRQNAPMRIRMIPPLESVVDVELPPARHARIHLRQTVDGGVVESHDAVVLVGRIFHRGSDL